MINQQFDLINKSDIDALIYNGVAETRTLEYKEKLPGNSDEDKKEFLADITSFANASGGDIIYGIQEQRDSNNKTTGIPERANGLDGINSDSEIRRLENIIRDGIAPRIVGLQTKRRRYSVADTRGKTVQIYLKTRFVVCQLQGENPYSSVTTLSNKKQARLG